MTELDIKQHIIDLYRLRKEGELVLRFGIIVCCVILLFVIILAPIVKADQLADLEQRLDLMEDKLQNIDKNESDNEVTNLAQRLDLLDEKLQKIGEKESENGINIGGHLKFALFDTSDGKRNGIKQHNGTAATISTVYLYLRKQLSDIVSVSVIPDISVSASATPSLGSNITRATSSTGDISLHSAHLDMLLPGNYELKLGSFSPYFSDEYASERFWDELLNPSKGLAYLQSMHDSGIELYKNYDFEDVSLPVYFYLLNGNTTRYGEFTDNNEGKSVMIHLAPEFYNGRLRLLGSAATGTWDTADDHTLIRYASGLNYKYSGFDLYGEYLYSNWKDSPLSGSKTADGIREGYYIRGMYKLYDDLRFLIKFSHSELYSNTITSSVYRSTMLTDTYDTLVFAFNYFLTDTSILIPSISIVDADRSDESEKLKYIRYNIGCRVNF